MDTSEIPKNPNPSTDASSEESQAPSTAAPLLSHTPSKLEQEVSTPSLITFIDLIQPEALIPKEISQKDITDFFSSAEWILITHTPSILRDYASALKEGKSEIQHHAQSLNLQRDRDEIIRIAKDQMLAFLQSESTQLPDNLRTLLQKSLTSQQLSEDEIKEFSRATSEYLGLPSIKEIQRLVRNILETSQDPDIEASLKEKLKNLNVSNDQQIPTPEHIYGLIENIAFSQYINVVRNKLSKDNPDEKRVQISNFSEYISSIFQHTPPNLYAASPEDIRNFLSGLKEIIVSSDILDSDSQKKLQKTLAHIDPQIRNAQQRQEEKHKNQRMPEKASRGSLEKFISNPLGLSALAAIAVIFIILLNEIKKS